MSAPQRAETVPGSPAGSGALIPAWVLFTLAAALFQTWRTALQQRLRSALSVNAAGLVRYLYALPVDAAMLASYALATQRALPAPGWGFLGWCALAGVAQILGTSLLILAFGHRGFAVGTAYAKTDAIQAAVVAWLLFGQGLPAAAWAGILVGLAGVLLLSLGGRGLRLGELVRATVQPGALCGLGAGTGLALAGVFAKGAIAALPGPDPVFRALCTLLVTNLLQTALQGGWMLWREPESLRAAVRTWRHSSRVGLMSALGSGCWFSAFSLAPVALVRTVGQTELALTLLFGRFYLGEPARAWDYAGVLLVGAGVVLVVAG